MIVKKLMLGMLMMLPMIVVAATSTPKGFTDNLDEALKRAKASGKFVYACFSGSDWCGWCIRLEKEVFADESFVKALKDDYEFVFIDSPRDQSRLSEYAKAHNRETTKKYGIQGFPSMIIFDGKDGSIVAQDAAYRQGGAPEYIKYLKGIRKDPAKIKFAKQLREEWVGALEKEYDALFRELDVECGKYITKKLNEPGNTRTREELRQDTLCVVKEMLPKFRSLQEKAEKQSKKAPPEIKPEVVEFAQSMADWIKQIEGMKK